MQPSHNADPLLFTDEEKTAIQEQLERLLTNTYFSNSRRFPALLRFVVESTLAGQAESLKERTLGVEIFGRTAHYDTGNDPIVRVTAAEVRKRIALYYREPGHDAELRLSLPSGSYVPQFDWPHPAAQPEASPVPAREDLRLVVADPWRKPARLEPADPEPKDPSPWDPARVRPESAVRPEPAASPKPTPTRRWTWILLLSLCAVAVLAVVLGTIRHMVAASPIQAFWAPVLNTPDPVLFCVADQTEYTNIALRDAAQPSHQSVLRDSLTAVVIDDIAPIADIAGVLRQNGKRYTVRGEGATTLNDLRTGPAVFIGAFDNEWTLRLLKPLRFHFANDPGMSRFWIVDGPGNRPTPWAIDRQQQISTNVYRDYAIVARFTDSNTGKLSVVVAGIGRGGTIAAGEFLTTPALLGQISSLARSPEKNLEVVLSTQVIGGQAGTPRVEASYTW